MATDDDEGADADDDEDADDDDDDEWHRIMFMPMRMTMMMMILSMTFSGHCHDYAFRNRYRCHGLLPAMNDPLPATRAPRGCCACDGSTATPRGSRRSPCARTWGAAAEKT